MIIPMLCVTILDRKSGSAGMPRPISYAVFCLKKKTATPEFGNPPADEVQLPASFQTVPAAPVQVNVSPAAGAARASTPDGGKKNLARVGRCRERTSRHIVRPPGAYPGNPPARFTIFSTGPGRAWTAGPRRGRMAPVPHDRPFFFNAPAPTEISTLSLHDALPI